MSKNTYLKAKNAPIVVIFIVWCLAIYAAFQAPTADFGNKLLSVFREFQIKDSVVIVISPILALVLTGIISPGNKARLVFLRWRHALPGHRVFSRLIKSDSRIDEEKLKQKIGELPTEPEAQNKLWYSLYKKCSEAVTVREAHRYFLLARDLATISFLFALAGPWSLLFFGHKATWALLYVGCMAGQYLLLSIVAQNHGNRFACNVITEYI